MALKSLDPRVRGDDDLEATRRDSACRHAANRTRMPRNPPTVMPAKAGIQGLTEA
jgi:hypothetical protein